MDSLPKILKSVAIVVTSICLSMLLWYTYFAGEWGDKIVMFWVGFPSGIISGILFLILNKYVLSKKLIAIQVITFLALIGLVNVLYYNAGDIWYFISGN